MKLKSKLNKLPKDVSKLLDVIAESAQKQGVPVYLVGGMVRDLIIGRKDVIWIL